MRTSEEPESDQDSPAVGKAVAILELLCANTDAVGVSDLSVQTGLNKNMVYRVLRTLMASGWVLQEDSGRYAVSLLPFHHFSKPAQRMDITVAAAEPVRELWRRTGQSTYLGTLDTDQVIYLQHLDATGPVRIAGHAGGRYALHCSAPGKVLLAHAPGSLLETLAARGLERQTSRTITDPQVLKDELAKVRRQGFALDLGEYAEGLLCFAAPIHDHQGRIAGTVGISVITIYCSQARLEAEYAPLVLDTAREISGRLGMPQEDRSRAGPATVDPACVPS